MPRRTATGVPPSVRDADIGRLLVRACRGSITSDLVSANFQRSLRVRRAGGWNGRRSEKKVLNTKRRSRRPSTSCPTAEVGSPAIEPHASGRVTPRRAPSSGGGHRSGGSATRVVPAGSPGTHQGTGRAVGRLQATAQAAQRGRRVRRPMPLLWQAPLFNFSGYGDEARAMILAMQHRGYPVTARSSGAEVAEFVDQLAASAPDRLVAPAPGDAAAARPPVRLRAACAGLRATRSREPRPTSSAPCSRRIPSRRTGWLGSNQMDEVWVPTAFNVETLRQRRRHRAHPRGARRSGRHVVPPGPASAACSGRPGHGLPLHLRMGVPQGLGRPPLGLGRGLRPRRRRLARVADRTGRRPGTAVPCRLSSASTPTSRASARATPRWRRSSCSSAPAEPG